MSKNNKQIIAQVEKIQNAQQGLRFNVQCNDEQIIDEKINDKQIPAFAIRYNDKMYAYLNRCGHIAVQLDFQPGNFFSEDKQNLVCSTHGASYQPESGKCLGGPCYGVGLEPLAVEEIDGYLYLQTEQYKVIKESV